LNEGADTDQLSGTVLAGYSTTALFIAGRGMLKLCSVYYYMEHNHG